MYTWCFDLPAKSSLSSISPQEWCPRLGCALISTIRWSFLDAVFLTLWSGKSLIRPLIQGTDSPASLCKEGTSSPFWPCKCHHLNSHFSEDRFQHPLMSHKNMVKKEGEKERENNVSWCCNKAIAYAMTNNPHFPKVSCSEMTVLCTPTPF